MSKKTDGPADESRKQEANYVPIDAPQDPGTQTPGVTKNPVQDMSKVLYQLQNSVREQQLSSEQQLSGALNQTFTYLGESQRLVELSDLANQLYRFAAGGAGELQGNLPQVKQVLTKLAEGLSSHQSKADSQVSAGLEQAISSMAQAHGSMMQSRALSQIGQMVKRCQDVLSWVENPSRMVE
ncbi:MAG: hypothetical protein AB1576_01890 [Bacillota bacterium]